MNMKGKIVDNHAVLSGTIHSSVSLTGGVSIPVGYEYYRGEYEIVPTTEEQVCLTKNKVLTDDITVKSIPMDAFDAVEQAAKEYADTLSKRVTGSIDEDGNFIVMFDEQFWTVD